MCLHLLDVRDPGVRGHCSYYKRIFFLHVCQSKRHAFGGVGGVEGVGAVQHDHLAHIHKVWPTYCCHLGKQCTLESNLEALNAKRAVSAQRIWEEIVSEAPPLLLLETPILLRMRQKGFISTFLMNQYETRKYVNEVTALVPGSRAETSGDDADTLRSV